MAVRLSTGMRNKLLDGGAAGGIKGYFSGVANAMIQIRTGPQPLTADTAATGTLLGTVTVNADGVTGLTFDAAVDGVISKAAAEVWKFTGVAAGTSGWFRVYPENGDPAILSTTEGRIDGNIATSGGDMNLSSISVAVSSPHTIDTFTFTMPAA